MQLRGGYTTDDIRLDRLPQFDERSRSYPIRTIVPKKPRSYSWKPTAWLDQGNEGACVGFSWAHELAARPSVNMVDDSLARQKIYREAQKIDEWAGEGYEGTSVLAGAKIVQKLGYMKEYRWSFSLEELILGIGYNGPSVLGINWYQGMFQTDDKGFIRPSGNIAGGHAILCYGVNLRDKYFKLHNSWGRDWGKDGTCYVSFDDMDRLIHEEGESVFPVNRIRL